MVRFVKATDLEGNIKDKSEELFIHEHPLGDWTYGEDYVRPGISLMFSYEDIPDVILRTTPISKVNHKNNQWVITTRNTIYYFEDVVED